MQINDRFHINEPNIVADIFGDEAVLVNLESGIYFSLRDTASQLWFRMINGYSAAEIIKEFMEIYDAANETIETQVQQFIKELVEKKLVFISASENCTLVDQSRPTPKLTFTAPVLETYSDMQEILLLDPVHDVDKEGWPVSKNK